jgi:caffeoyl-CoA O-methyltransferase
MLSSDLMNKYLDEHAHSLDPKLAEVERNTYLNTLQPHMLSGRNQAVFLKLLTLISNAKIVIEIGTFTGYTALAFAEAVGENGKVITLECDKEIAEIAKENFSQSIYKDRIELVIGEAKVAFKKVIQSTIPDLVFIDADKESNALYYNIAIENMKSGGIVLVDNVLWKGKVVDKEANDKKTKAIKAFNDMVNTDMRVDACILSIRDGIYFIRKK